MKQEHKELLTRDLGMRITHGVKVQYEQYNTMYRQEIIGCGTKYVTFDVSQCDDLDYEEGTTEHTILYLDSVKPCLFPLSMLTEEITINGETFIPCEKFGFVANDVYQRMLEYSISSKNIPLKRAEYLLSTHFDIHRLIELGLAIDATTVKCYE